MKTFYEAIYEWVADNFGENEADDPSWSIEALADHLSKTDIKPDELNACTKNSVYNKLDQHFVEEEVEEYAGGYAEYKDLTKQQVKNIASKVRNSDWYRFIGADDMEWYINQELKKGE